MIEIERSKDLVSLFLRKQFLQENDILCQIMSGETDLSELPFNPVNGVAYHLDSEAALMVAEEDYQDALALLNNIEIPVGEEEPIRNSFGQTGEGIQNTYKRVGRILCRLSLLIGIAGLLYAIFLSIR